MRDPLKEFIHHNRPEMDTAEPSKELWNKIETRMNFAPGIAAKTTPWLKHFFFGASVITVATVISAAWPKMFPSETSAFIPTLQQENKKVMPEILDNPANAEPVNFPLLAPVNEPAENVFAPLMEITPNYFPEISAFTLMPDTISDYIAPIPPSKENNSYRMESSTMHVDTLFNGITRLEITGDLFDVNIKGHSESSLHVHGDLSTKAKNNETRYEVTITRHDTVLKVHVGTIYENKYKSCVINSSSDALLNFDVPEKINLLLQDNYGNAEISGLRGSVLDVKMSTGDLALSNIQTNPKITLSYGDLTATGIKGNITSRTSTGSSTMSNVVGNVDASTTYGDQKLTNITGELKLVSSTGSVDITNATGNATIKTTYGDIDLQNYKGTPSFVTSTGSIKGKNVELTGNANFTTTYGDISIALVNKMDALSFDLVTTYGDILINKNGQRIEKDDKLELQKGSILIRARTSTGSQEYQ